MKKKYSIIYIDPPWTYGDKLNHGKRGASHKYSTMSRDELKQLDVPGLADENCALFMWWTPVMIREALELVDIWGFTLKTAKVFTWRKLNLRNGQEFMGLGHWSRGNTEDCLLAVKGKPRRADTSKARSIRQLISEPRREHSRKPDCARKHIVTLLGDLPRIELFARETVEGWDSWGNEVGKFDSIP